MPEEFKRRVILHGKGSTSGDTELLTEDADHGNLRVAIAQGDNILPLDAYSSNSVSASTIKSPSASFLYLYNGANWSRAYGNYRVSLLESATRNSTTVTPVQANYNGRGVIVGVYVTQAAAGETLTPAIQIRDPGSGIYISVLTGPTISTTGNYLMLMYPGADGSGGSFNAVCNAPLPQAWRLLVEHSGSGNWTYSAGCSYIL